MPTEPALQADTIKHPAVFTLLPLRRHVKPTHSSTQHNPAVFTLLPLSRQVKPTQSSTQHMYVLQLPRQFKPTQLGELAGTSSQHNDASSCFYMLQLSRHFKPSQADRNMFWLLFVGLAAPRYFWYSCRMSRGILLVRPALAVLPPGVLARQCWRARTITRRNFEVGT